VHGKQDSLAYTGSVAEQVTSAAAAMPRVMCSHRQVPVTIGVQRRSALTVVAGEGHITFQNLIIRELMTHRSKTDADRPSPIRPCQRSRNLGTKM